MLWRGVRSSAWNVCPQARAVKASPPALPGCARCPGSGGLQHPPAPSFRCRPTPGETTGPPPGQRRPFPHQPPRRTQSRRRLRAARPSPPLPAAPRSFRLSPPARGPRAPPALGLDSPGNAISPRAGSAPPGPLHAGSRSPRREARWEPEVGADGSRDAWDRAEHAGRRPRAWPLLRRCGLLGVGVSGEDGSIFW